MRESVTRALTSCVSFSVWLSALSIHFCCPTSISSTFRLVAMTVMGVLSSCEASVMNCFCRSDACTTGAMARREQSTTMPYTSTTHTAIAASDIHANVTTACSS